MLEVFAPRASTELQRKQAEADLRESEQRYMRKRLDLLGLASSELPNVDAIRAQERADVFH
jgi:hypothetical protein